MKLGQMVLSAALLIISLQIAAQDRIYKKNGEIVKAKILNASGKSISFKHYEPTDSLTYFLNNTAIDSIIFHDGVKKTFINNISDSHILTRNLNPVFNHHLIGVDLMGYLLYRNLTLSYEFLPGKANIGFKAAFAKNVEQVEYPVFNFNRYPNWSARLGINYYFFPPRTFRLGTGLYYVFGKYSTWNYFSYNEPNSTPIIQTDNKNMNGVVLSLFGFYNLTKNLAINLGLDVPLQLVPKSSIFYTAIRCEILFNF